MSHLFVFNRFNHFLRSSLQLFHQSAQWLIILTCMLAVSNPFESAWGKTSGKQSVDFVICIDNSKSIQGQDQVLIRETVMLLADLADSGDRIAVLTFGNRAQTVAIATINNDEDRISFKRQALQGIHFRDDLSDIAALFHELVQKKADLFRPKEAISSVILLSDGKLEPANKNPQEGLAAIEDALANQLTDIDINAVVLGNTSCMDPIPKMPRLTGLQLMKDYIAKATDHFKHAKKLDQLFEIVLNILNQTKGISSLGEEDKSRFLLDDTVESMTLIVRKKDASGKALGRSQDISLKHDTGDRGNPAKSFSSANSGNNRLTDGSAAGIYWSDEYQYFDLIAVRKPAGGHWAVEMANGQKPEVLNKIVSPIQLGFSFKDVYYSEEKGLLTAWILDKKSGEVVTDRPFKIQARLATDTPEEASKTYLDLRPAEKGKYILTVPDDLQSRLAGKNLPITLHAELIARSYQGADSKELDPWFIRRSVPFDFEVAPPIFSALMTPEKFLTMPIAGSLAEKMTGLPLLTDALYIGGDVLGQNSQIFPFDLPPSVRAKIERVDNQHKPLGIVWEGELTGIIECAIRTAYSGYPPANLFPPGSYQVTYQISGFRKNGEPLSLEGSVKRFEVISYNWVIYRIVIPVLILLILAVVSSLTAVLKGTTVEKSPEGKVIKTIPIRTKRYTEVNCFRLEAVCLLFVHKRIKLTTLGSSVKVNGQPLPKNPIHLKPNSRHRITCGQRNFEILLSI